MYIWVSGINIQSYLLKGISPKHICFIYQNPVDTIFTIVACKNFTPFLKFYPLRHFRTIYCISMRFMVIICMSMTVKEKPLLNIAPTTT